MPTQTKAEYRAYMLRLWWVQREQGPTWRVSLEDARTGERRGFADLEALFSHLRTGPQQGVAERKPKGADDDQDAA